MGPFGLLRGRRKKEDDDDDEKEGGVSFPIIDRPTPVKDLLSGTSKRKKKSEMNPGGNPTGGNPGGESFKLLPAMPGGHTHTAKLDLEGNGSSTYDHGHSHDVRGYQVQSSNTPELHTHALQPISREFLEEAPATWVSNIQERTRTLPSPFQNWIMAMSNVTGLPEDSIRKSMAAFKYARAMGWL